MYVTDTMSGWRRQGRGSGFVYFDETGRRIRDEAQLARIRALAIPPAYRDVWICPWPHGHVQATGRDARGRKQYRYHPDWLASRNGDKFGRMAQFGRALARLRRQVRRDLALPGLPREKVVATLVHLLDTTYARVGSAEYARHNGSFGLTTLKDRHARWHGGTVRLCFRGKSGVPHELEITDARIARILRRCHDLPGQQLFQYVDAASGEQRAVGSADVNDYLRAHMPGGNDFSAKDFRTWHASVLAFARLERCEPPASAAAARRALNEVLAEVAGELKHTVAVCRRSYVHPQVLAWFESGRLASRAALPAETAARALPRGLSACERRFLALLAQQQQQRGPRVRRGTPRPLPSGQRVVRPAAG